MAGYESPKWLQHNRAVTRGAVCTCGCGQDFGAPEPAPTAPTAFAPVEGTVGIGVGIEEEWGFRSMIWFQGKDRAEAEAFAEQWGYVVREGIAL